jgi:hypothetical protein
MTTETKCAYCLHAEASHVREVNSHDRLIHCVECCPYGDSACLHEFQRPASGGDEPSSPPSVAPEPSTRREEMRHDEWLCVRQRSHGTCNTINSDEDESCGACGDDRPAAMAPPSAPPDKFDFVRTEEGLPNLNSIGQRKRRAREAAVSASPETPAPTAIDNPAPERIRLIATTYRDGVWIWDDNVRREPSDIGYANAVEYVRVSPVASPATPPCKCGLPKDDQAHWECVCGKEPMDCEWQGECHDYVPVAASPATPTPEPTAYYGNTLPPDAPAGLIRTADEITHGVSAGSATTTTEPTAERGYDWRDTIGGFPPLDMRRVPAGDRFDTPATYEELVDAYVAQIEHTNTVRAEYQRRLAESHQEVARLRSILRECTCGLATGEQP